MNHREVYRATMYCWVRGVVDAPARRVGGHRGMAGGPRSETAPGAARHSPPDPDPRRATPMADLPGAAGTVLGTRRVLPRRKDPARPVACLRRAHRTYRDPHPAGEGSKTSRRSTAEVRRLGGPLGRGLGLPAATCLQRGVLAPTLGRYVKCHTGTAPASPPDAKTGRGLLGARPAKSTVFVWFGSCQ